VSPTAFQADGRFFKIQKKFPLKKFFENGNIQRRLHDGDLRPPFCADQRCEHRKAVVVATRSSGAMEQWSDGAME
jgi:hypothetical protein